ncbi:hypothetical protein LTR37_002040 [Vermiconidia calcicola]|uniref:Uncharacterized protein n=1 Tax=Vermiconidia calcicola TaxID=1690605 RepID=A0ACC3NTP0_9PEZI|nr:hypothetical protein LTR37_002040 [Vermiconidia calcicola]
MVWTELALVGAVASIIVERYAPYVEGAAWAVGKLNDIFDKRSSSSGDVPVLVHFQLNASAQIDAKLLAGMVVTRSGDGEGKAWFANEKQGFEVNGTVSELTNVADGLLMGRLSFPVGEDAVAHGKYVMLDQAVEENDVTARFGEMHKSLSMPEHDALLDLLMAAE